MNEFYYFGSSTEITSNEISVRNPKRIYVGDHGHISKNVQITVSDNKNKDFEYNLKIKNYFFINSFSKIEAINYIEIGNYVIIGPYVHISDMVHEYEYYNIPIKLQGLRKAYENKVIIEDGAWVGAGVRIVGNITIGYGAVIGANAVVTKDIPDHSVAVGVPARVIKIFDYSKNKWVDVKNNNKLLQKTLSTRGEFNGYNFDLIEKKVKNAKTITDVPETINDKIDKIVIIFGKLRKVVENIMVLLKEEKYKESKLYLLDLTSNLDTIQTSIRAILSEEDLELFKVELIQLNENLNDIITVYETNNYDNAYELFGNKLLSTLDSLGNRLLARKK